jgi:hypothetical protein
LTPPEGGLPELDSRKLANVIGVSACVITSDNRVILKSRPSLRKRMNIGSNYLSASGSVQWSDIKDEKEFRKNGLHLAITREIADKLKIPGDKILSVRLLGFAREYLRLGKPEFFFLVQVGEDYLSIIENLKGKHDPASLEPHDISNASFEIFPKDPVRTKELLFEKIDSLSLDPISKAGLFFWIRYLDENEKNPKRSLF